jgi:hypothetical protein
VTVQVGQLFREEDDILSVVCMIRVNIASALSFLKDRKRRLEEVNGSLKFLSKLSTTVSKSISKGTQIKATKKHEPPRVKRP